MMSTARPSPPRATHLRAGALAETQACAFLESHGLRCLERNFRTRLGEIDLIMDDRGTRVFVEVRFRRNRRYGSALESVDRRKQARLIAAAQYYLGSHRGIGASRFDVVGVEPGPAADPCFFWVKNAFQEC